MVQAISGIVTPIKELMDKRKQMSNHETLEGFGALSSFVQNMKAHQILTDEWIILSQQLQSVCFHSIDVRLSKFETFFKAILLLTKNHIFQIT